MKLARDQAALVKSPSHIETAVVVNSTKNCIPRDTSFGFRHPLDWHLLNNTLVNWSPVCSPGTWNFLELSRLVTKWECCVLQIFPMFTTVVNWVQNSLLTAAQYDYKYTVICLWTHCLINFFFLWRITKNSVTELSKNDIIPSTHLWESIFRRRHLLWLWLLNISHFIHSKKTLRTGPPVDLRKDSGNNLEYWKEIM